MSAYKIDFQSGGNETNPTIPGKTSIVLPQNTINSTSTSISLTGYRVEHYGEIQQENYIRLMENFASKTAPSNPTVGQLWFNSTINSLMLFDMNQTWIPAGAIIISSTTPTNPLSGALWFNTNDQVLYLCIDVTKVGNKYPRFYPDGTGPWVQVWPSINQYAGWQDYNDIALRLNRVIGAPSTYSSGTGTGYSTQWGWGQTDTAPMFTSVNTPAPYTNDAWVVLLSRMRKAMRHVGLNESSTSTVGFIDDGRPSILGNATATAYNNYPAVGSLPDYSAGTGGRGFVGLNTQWAAAVSALSALEAARFTPASTSVESTSSPLGTTTNTTAWSTAIQSTVNVTFTSEAVAKAYFNSGGTISLNTLMTSAGSDTLSAGWLAFLTGVGAVTFDYKGAKTGSTYFDYSSLSGGSAGVYRGFYDLNTNPTTIFQAINDATSGSALTISAVKNISSGTCVVTFTVTLSEPSGSNVNGTTVLRINGTKANSTNVNSPVIAWPAVTVSAFAAGTGPTTSADIIPLYNASNVIVGYGVSPTSTYAVSATVALYDASNVNFANIWPDSSANHDVEFDAADNSVIGYASATQDIVVDPVVTNSTVTIYDTNSAVLGYALPYGSTSDATATVVLYDAAGVVYALIWPSSSTNHNIAFTDASGTVLGYISNISNIGDLVAGSLSLVSVSPTSGTPAGGGTVTLSGSGFVSGATVLFGSTAATNVTFVNSTSLTATVPAGTGTVDITVTNPDASSVTLGSAYSYTTVTYTATFAIVDAAGTTQGYGFGPTDNIDPAATVQMLDANSVVICNIYPSSGGTHTTQITDASGAQIGYAVDATGGVVTPPTVGSITVTAVSPTVGPNTSTATMTITGTGFVSGAIVSVGGVQVTPVTFTSSTSLTATLVSTTGTPLTAGIKNVTVTNPDGGTATLANAYTVVTYSPALSMSASPSNITTNGTTSVVTLSATGLAPNTQYTAAIKYKTSTGSYTSYAPAGTNIVVNLAANSSGTATATFTTGAFNSLSSDTYTFSADITQSSNGATISAVTTTAAITWTKPITINPVVTASSYPNSIASYGTATAVTFNITGFDPNTTFTGAILVNYNGSAFQQGYDNGVAQTISFTTNSSGAATAYYTSGAFDNLASGSYGVSLSVTKAGVAYPITITPAYTTWTIPSPSVQVSVSPSSLQLNAGTTANVYFFSYNFKPNTTYTIGVLTQPPGSSSWVPWTYANGSQVMLTMTTDSSGTGMAPFTTGTNDGSLGHNTTYGISGQYYLNGTAIYPSIATSTLTFSG